MREMEEVREYLLALTREAHEMNVKVDFAEVGEFKTPLIGKIVAWSLNYAVDVIDGCQIGFGQEDSVRRSRLDRPRRHARHVRA